jgi:hypothetical protein
MNKKNLKRVVFSLLILLPFQTAVAQNSTLDKANEAFDKHDFKTALVLYEKVLEKETDNLDVIMWASQAAKKERENEKQISLLRLLVKKDSKRLKGRKLLIKALEENNQTVECETEIKELISVWKLQSDEVKKKETYFSRDYFTVGEYNVGVFQYYKLKGEMAKRYHFLVQKGKNTQPYAITLGSYDSTTQIERELGNIKSHERVWHLDGYTGKQHFTYAFFNKELTYLEVKEMVIKIVEDDDIGKKSISSSSFNGGVLP